MKVLVAGASGFVGRRLSAALVSDGHDVMAMTRHPDRYAGAGTPVPGDVGDPASLGPAMAGCEAAYYLVHSLSESDFERKDADAAAAFGAAAARSGLRRGAAAWATKRTCCRLTCAAAARSRSCSGRPGSLSP